MIPKAEIDYIFDLNDEAYAGLMAFSKQVAGAIGTAVFVTLMASGAATLVADGVPEAAATAAGVRDAFLVGAIVSLGAVVLSFFVTRPDGEGLAGGVGH